MLLEQKVKEKEHIVWLLKDYWHNIGAVFGNEGKRSEGTKAKCVMALVSSGKYKNCE